MTNLLLLLLVLLGISQGQVSNRLDVGMTSSPVVEGEPLELWCTVTTALSTQFESCQWTTPLGNLLTVNGADGTVTDENNEVSTEVTADISNPLSCRIRMAQFNQLGAWTCKVTTSGVSQFQEATLNAISAPRVSDVRLPQEVTPVEYTVRLIPHIVPDDFAIDGEMSVRLQTISGIQDRIVLHSKEIVIFEDTVTVVDVSSGVDIPVSGFGYDRDRDFFVVHLSIPLPAEVSVTLSLNFRGILNADLSGFYRSSYVDPADSSTHLLAITQFQATDARKAFPCLDEPAMKAVFKISLGRTAVFSSASNMPIEQSNLPVDGKPDYFWDVFEPTPKMSTYLLAFLISDFRFRESTVGDGEVPFRIWAKPQLYDSTEYASQIGPQILKFYDDYFDLPFPLPKQDMAAIPDLSFGGMENWGLVTYRESVLLFQPGVSSVQAQSRIADVVAHELAHQWFGDLVTMGWWSDLWLNEGFATYMALKGSDAVEARFAAEQQALLSINHPAFALDALDSSHPVEAEVNHPDEINEIFDAISYEKGAALIRMMVAFLGESTFQKGIHDYLAEFQYGNAFTADLMTKLTEAGIADGSLPEGLTVNEIMDTWTTQKGFPYLTVTRADLESPRTLTVQQSRFLMGEKDPLDVHDYRWWVPISYAYSGSINGFEDTSTKAWINPLDATTQVELAEPPPELNSPPFVLNVKGASFFRVNYEEDNWLALAAALQADVDVAADPVTRAQLLGDSMALAAHGSLSYPVALEMTEYLDTENEYVPWSSALSALSYMSLMMQRAPDAAELASYLVEKLAHVYDDLGYDTGVDDGYFDVLLRSLALRSMCGLNYGDCVSRATADFAAWMSSESPDLEASNTIDAGIRSTVYCTAIGAGGAAEWDFLQQRYLSGTNANEMSTILSALGCSKDAATLQRYLDMALDPNSGLRVTDGLTVVTAVSSNSVGTPLAWTWLQTEWDAIRNYYDTAVSSPVSRMVTAVTRSFNTEQEVAELRQFQLDNAGNLGTAERATESAVKTAESNLGWMNSYYDEVVAWLKGRSGEGPSGSGGVDLELCYGLIVCSAFAVLRLTQSV